MTLAIVRIRGIVNVRGDIKDTLRMLRLNRVNHCVILPETPAYKGMLRKAKDYITWGEIKVDILTKMLFHHGYAKDQKLKDAYIKKNTKYKSLWSYAKAVCEGKERFARLEGANPVLRLHPPIKGYEGIKRSYKDGGALGYRGADINKLLDRMIFIREKKEKKREKKKVEKKEKKKLRKKVKSRGLKD